MITIIENCENVAQAMRTNDIPEGQVFRGEIWGANSHRWTRGLFYKANSSWVERRGDARIHDVLIVRLDAQGSGGYSNMWDTCSAVRNYEPQIATITLTPQK